MAREKFLDLREIRYNRKYEILLLSFLILIFGDVFFPSDFDETPILIIQNVLASTLVFYGKKRWRLPLVILLSALIILEILNLFSVFSSISVVFSLLYIIYFAFLSIEVYGQILKAKEVNIGMVAAVLCGFIMLSLIGGYVFILLEVFQSGSFRNLNTGSGGIGDLVYFSFITVLSIGYGDITPESSTAKNAVVFFGLLGHFYSVVIIGIVIGKYISKSE